MDNQNTEMKTCKYCMTQIPKKAKICPNCKKKQSHTVRWIILGVIILLLLLNMFGKSGSKNAESENTVENEKAETTVVENKKDEADGKTYSENDFDVKEYLYENTIGDTLYFLIVTNNSKANVAVSGNATAKDSSGNSIGADDMDIAVVGAGETSFGYFYFDGVTGIDSVDYSLKYSDSLYDPVINNLEVEQTTNDENVIVSATNKGNKEAEFVMAQALFFDENNNVIWESEDYITDDELKIKPNDTLSVQLDCYKGYDHVEVYFTGRAGK